MKKRLLSLVLAIAMLCTILPQIPLEAEAYSNAYSIPVPSGDTAADVAAIAESQCGYMYNNGTVYGAWWGTVVGDDQYTYSAWCGMFACWCAYQAGAGLGKAYDKNAAAANELFNWLKKNATHDTSFSSDPLKGDFIFFDDNNNGTANHVAIVTDYNSSTKTVTFVGGNQGGAVTRETCSWSKGSKWGSQYVLGYGRPNYCEHSYKDCGVCSTCGYVYDWESTLDTTETGRYKALSAFTPRIDQPYAAATGADFCVVSGSTYNVVGVYTNAYKTDGVPNKWYKFECNGDTYYGYSGDFEFVEYFDQAITGTITSPAEGSTIPQADYTLKGTVTSTRYPIQRIDAFLDGTWYAGVTLGNKMSYSLQGSSMDTELDFASLSPGQHRVTIQARDVHRESMTNLCTRYFYIEGDNSYTLSFSATGDTTMDSITAASGATVTIPATIPELFGFNFEGWEASDGTVYQPGDSFALTKNVTLTARWVNYWITYENSGRWHHNMEYPGTGYYFKLHIPEQGVYKIVGHSTFDTKVSLYDPNGNLIVSDDDSGEDNQFLVTANLSTQESYYMVCIEPYYSADMGDLIWSVTKGKTLEYRDQFTQDVYEVDFIGQPTIGVNEFEGVITNFVPTRAGYTFLGWSTSSTATTPMYKPGDYAVIEEDSTSYNMVVLYPVWEGATEFPGYRQTYSYTIQQSGEGKTFLLTVPADGTYRFMGLNDKSLDTKIAIYDSNGNEIAADDDSGGNWQFSVHCDLTAGEEYTVKIFPYSSSATGTMQWQIDRAYSLRYIAPEADEPFEITNWCYLVDPCIALKYETTIIGNDLIREGYRFLGWSIDSNATTPMYFPEETVVLDYSNYSFDFLSVDYAWLYPVWERTEISGACGDNLTWTLDDAGTLTISGTGPMTNYNNGEAPWYSDIQSIKNVVIESGVTSVGNGAFYGCNSLTDVTVSNSVTNIGENAFYNCISLTEVTIPDSVTSIGYRAFYNCDNLQSVIIPDSVITIDAYAFAYCDILQSVTLGNSITTIGEQAFCGCYCLTEVTIPASTSTIGVSAFSRCSGLTGIWVDAENSSYCSDSYGVLFDKNKTTLIEAPGKLSGIYVIPDRVTTIGKHAFVGCHSLTEVAISDSVTGIGDYAFNNCSNLTKVTISDSVTTIGKSAFIYCSKLTEVTIPASVTTIGESAFYYCSSLTDVYYGGTQDQWEAIAIDENNECLTNATLHCHTHDYTTTTVAATCTTAGYTEYTCTCGDSYREGISALGHDYSVTVSNTAPGCEVQGSTVKKCSRCDSTDTTYTPALGHNMVEVPSVAPTCTETGLTAGTKCDRCGEVGTVQTTVAALGHSFTNYIGDGNATCTEDGTKTAKCDRCDATDTETDVDSKLGHDYSVTVSNTAPGCDVQGSTVKKCSRCDSTDTTYTPALGHNMVEVTAVAPTCTATGLTAGTKCDRCGEVGTAQTTVAATGHNYVNGVCSNCGNVNDVNAPQILLESKTVAKGKTFTVTAEIKNNPGFSYLEVTPVIPSQLTLVEVENGELISDFTKGKQYVWVADEDVTDDGVLMTFIFSTDGSVEPGIYQISFNIRTCANYAEELLTFHVVDAEIEVTDTVYGDATGDGTVDGLDVIRLKKYLANYDYDTDSSTIEISLGADANGDGKVDGLDVIRLKKYLANYDYETGESTVILGPQ